MLQAEKISLHAPAGIPASMLADYVRRCLAALPDVEAALDRLDHNYLRVYGHRLKGSGGGYGIPVITQLGALIEDAARRSDTARVQSQIAALVVYLNRIEILPD
jgi:HPt (histidine-containing phosphotransfer) domain-containing protein